MQFTLPVFLFGFLPLALAGYFLVPRPVRNGLLLAGSLLFYAWGEQEFIAVLLVSIILNYLLGLVLDRPLTPDPSSPGSAGRKWAVGLAVALNLGLLAAFKYADFLVANLNAALDACGLAPLPAPGVHLPLGISFFTFHALSYVLDVYRGEVRALKNPVDFALYIAFFPQSIAGPIVRYHDLAAQLVERTVTREGFAAGARQFIYGLSKKMLIANTLAGPADAIFGLPASALTAGLAWLGAVCYTLQLYFDFSGYSDMAIGLARLFGFEFKPNFDYPYTSRSVTEFWRRWHMSLSSWFRDYLYVPLGGNRRGPVRTYLNLALVFFLCGLWHGASWTFVVWGLYHGAFLVLERLGLGRLLERLPSLLRRAYLLLAVVAGWVFFRAETFAGAVGMLRAAIGLGDGSAVEYTPAAYLANDAILALAAGAIFSAPVLPWLGRLRQGVLAGVRRTGLAQALDAAFAGLSVACLALLLLAAEMQVAGGTHNPFIYFRF
jgi:alginate O-acetyltransferase complex protein AlgI